MRQLALLAGAWLACGGTPPVVAPQRAAPPPTPPPIVVRGSDWEEIPVDPKVLPPAAIERDKLVRPELAARFEELPQESRDALETRGVLTVARRDRVSSMGEAYVALARKHVPLVITLDVLLGLTFRSVDRALDELDQDVLAPTLKDTLEKTLARLSAESRAARSDTAAPYTLARTVAAVGLALLEPSAELPPELREPVAAEAALVRTHTGFARSPLLGRTIDYGAFDVQAGLAFGDPRAGAFRAMAWMARAPLTLVPEKPAADIGKARMHTRAAMLLARALPPDFDKLAGAMGFVVGRGDDPGPAELLARVSALGEDVRTEASIVDVVGVDKLRTSLARNAVATVEDTGDTMPTFRWLSPSAPEDVRALAQASSANALMVAVALGSADARALAGPEAKDVTVALPQGQAERHESLHASALDALATYLAPSAFDAGRGWRSALPWQKRKLDVALTAWATLRHGELPFAHGSAKAVLDDPPLPFDVPAAVEPHAEAIARLQALVRQCRRGLAAHGTLHAGSSADVLLGRVEGILADALDIATTQGSAALSATQTAALTSMPSRIVAVERRLGPAAAPLVVVTAVDAITGKSREEATGYVNDVWLALDVAGATRLFVGVAVPFYELTSTLRSTDSSWAKQLAESGPPSRPSWVE